MDSRHVSDQSTQPPVAGEEAMLARRYVGSLYALAEQAGQTDEVVNDLRALRRLWDECSEWRFIASDPRLSNDNIRTAVSEICKVYKFGKLTANFLSVIVQNRRLSLLPSFIKGFLTEVATRRGEYRVDVRTAHSLSTAQHDALLSSLNTVMGGKVHMNVIEDTSLLGGFTVKLGSQFIDASVKTKLDRLKRTLKGAA
jgi:F-type H+-transporting ATPase subunit delta